MLEEYKRFALRGNVVDLAVGAIIGAAFRGIVTLPVQDIIEPIIGAATGGLDFSDLIRRPLVQGAGGLAYADAKKQGAVTGYGQFLTPAINFLIISFVPFLPIRGMSSLLSKEEAKPNVEAEVPADVKLLAEIRDLLAERPVEAVPVAPGSLRR